MHNIDPKLNEYIHQWGARSIPFNDAEGQKPFESEQTRQAEELLQQTAALRSVMLLSGDNGVGKSSLAAHWARKLEPSRYLPVIITQATLGASGLLSTLLNKLGEQPAGRRATNLIQLEKAIHQLGGIIPVVLLDEAQNYHASALEELRLLLGLNLPVQPLFSLILIGDRHLLSTLRLQCHRALYSRISSTHTLTPLVPDQIDPYLRHGLRQSGLDRQLYEPAAIDLLTAASEGVPRTINHLARTAWIEASIEKSSTITAQHLQTALARIPIARDKINL
jgi:general secretion pathway protein A